MNTTNTYIKHEGNVYSAVKAGDWDAVLPAEVPIVLTKPTHRWNGGKITTELWQRVLRFLEWSQEHTKSEAVLHLLYHDVAREWEAIVLPQEGYTGMTVKLLPDHPDRADAFRSLPVKAGSSWELMGTVHHHCGAGAFQSGTDSADEKTKEGLHLTIGNLNDKQYSIHARSSFRGTMHEATLTDWFEFDSSGLPQAVFDTVLRHRLTAPTMAADDVFPIWWKANVIKVAQPVALGFNTAWKPKTAHPQFGLVTGSYDHYIKQTAVESAALDEPEPSETMVGWFMEDLSEIAQMFHSSTRDVCEMLVEARDAMYRSGMTPTVAFALLEEMQKRGYDSLTEASAGPSDGYTADERALMEGYYE
jgi:hypothetical protein